jgi:hypothetical protein
LPIYRSLVTILSIMQEPENEHKHESSESTEHLSIDRPSILESPRDEDMYVNAPSVSVANTHVVADAPKSTSAGIIVLQWLTYAFWGWTLLVANWLIYIVIDSLLTDDDLSSMIPYSIAATLVLLPISVICDLFYGKHEPAKKTGAAMVVMIIHAVIFALFCIGSLIMSVFIFVQMAIQTQSNPATMNAWLFTFLASAVLYGFTFLRTLNPLPKLKLNKIFPLGMLVIIIIFTVLAFIGPYAKSLTTRDDRDIVSGLSYVSDSINEYVNKNNKLPAALNNVTFDQPQARAIIDKGLVTYKPEGKSKTIDNNSESAGEDGVKNYSYDYKYQLCVTYKASSGDSYYRNSSNYASDDQYNSSAYVSDHPIGPVCYKVKASVYVDSASSIGNN